MPRSFRLDPALERRLCEVAAREGVPVSAVVREAIERHCDLPMDLADASLVALAVERHLDRVFTLDSDLNVYRLPRGRRFVVIP